jgi:hypothetical protein
VSSSRLFHQHAGVVEAGLCVHVHARPHQHMARCSVSQAGEQLTHTQVQFISCPAH